ncbi:GNAT family N-acetyltransferase [Roseovarius gahaiensis]|uniref:L-ornithine N(alpha)-acyltransferase n=1 Tax=Roseovarius gahaiensis TaxID=2716691 RepID=A0A967BCP1_9RHOB|nr:GNAT family N-acyltransferase [Roseovarius gahaiensis]NHQ75570.1 GNAT family N-acetyltransferase [Roseovarius gahaiensis]
MPLDHAPKFRTKLAETLPELRAAQRLRYDVFVDELGGDGAMVDHAARLEQDRFDPFFDHLLLIDDAANGTVVGVYRLLRDDQAARAGQFYSEDEYDLYRLKHCNRKVMELGRSCLHRDYRGGAGLYCLWSGLARYIHDHHVEILFGVASFHGTDPQILAQPLSLLHHRHLAPEPLRVKARECGYQPLDILSKDAVDRRAAMVQMPPLIKAYLRLGGYIGEGAFVDRDFNTIDVCLVVDTKNINDAQKAIYYKSDTR